MTNGEKIKAILKPRKDQIRIYGNWVEIEIQSLAINFSCGLNWWNAEYNEPTRKTCNSCGNFGSHNGVCDICNPKYNDLWREKPNCSENPTSSTTKNDLGVECRSLEDIKKLVESKADDLDGVMLDASGVIIGLYFAIANDLSPVTPISKDCTDCIAEDKTFMKMDRIKQLLNSDKLDDSEVLEKIREEVEE